MSNRPLSEKVLTVSNFSGGITDNYLGNADSSKFKEADNIIINEYEKTVSRPGSVIRNETSPRISTGFRIHDVVEVKGEIYQHSEKSIWFDNGVDQEKILGPDLNEVFPQANEYTQSSFVEYNDQLISSSDERESIVKVYKNQLGDYKALALGLPRVDLYTAIVLANSLKAKYETHRVSTSAHTAGADTINAITAPNASDFDSLVNLIDDFVVAYSGHQIDAAAILPSYHQGTENIDSSLEITRSPQTAGEAISILEHLVLKFNLHDNNNFSHATTGGFQETTASKPYAESAISGSNNYIYGLYYEHSYQVDDETFLERGPVTVIEGKDLVDPATATRRIYNIGELINSPNTHYETSEVKIVIGRSLNNGDVIYLVDRIDNGVTQWVDDLADTDIENNETFYIEGGFLDNDPPPKAKYLSLANDIVAYSNLKEGNTIESSKVRFSKKFQPYACPEDFLLEFEQAITGASNIGVYHIIFSKNRMWRIEGFIDDLGRGQFIKRQISSKTGCISNRSIIQIEEGLLFASADGFYFTDGFRVNRISKQFKERYSRLIAKEFINGCFDKKNNIALFGCRNENGQDYNDIIFCANLNFRQGEDVCFTTWSGVGATSLNYINDNVVRGDVDGYVYDHSFDYSNDPVVDNALSVEDWLTKPIIYNYESCAYDFGMPSVRKWISKIQINANNKSSLSLNISASNDNLELFKELKPIINDTNIVWGDSSLTWGSASLRWNYIPVISAWRRFPSRSLRCQYKQIRLTNEFRLISSSVQKGTCTIDNTTNEITLDDITKKWGSSVAGYYISFETDDYQTQFLIKERTDLVLTVEDLDNSLVDGSGVNWVVKGFKKGEVISLIDYSLVYSDITMTQSQYRGESA